MACHSRRNKSGNEQGAQGSHFESCTYHFFKVLNGYSLQLGKIAIPPKFIRKYGNDLSDKVLLKVPSGDSFEVTLEEAEGKVWLGKGWRKFQDYYSLGVGSFLLFEPEGNNVFNVLIFDLTCTEIDYPVEGSQDKQSKLSDEYLPSETQETGDGSPVESTDTSEPEPKRRQFKPQFQHEPSKPSKSKLLVGFDNDSSTYSQSSQSESEYSRPKRRTARPWKQVNQSHASPGLAGKKARIVKKPLPPSSHIALEAAKKYRPEFPAFRVRLRPSYMRSGGVSICSKFMKKNKFEPGQSIVKLKHRGRSWAVKMFCYQNEHRGKLCSGWGAFLEDNCLRNGDVCVFELVEKNVFDVRFYRCLSYS